ELNIAPRHYSSSVQRPAQISPTDSFGRGEHYLTRPAGVPVAGPGPRSAGPAAPLKEPCGRCHTTLAGLNPSYIAPRDGCLNLQPDLRDYVRSERAMIRNSRFSNRPKGGPL